MQKDYTNKKVGCNTALYFVKNKGWMCICDCGNERILKSSKFNIITTRCKKCFTPLSNNNFGRLQIINTHLINNIRFADCLCDCGNKKTINLSSIKSGLTKSCGCISGEILELRNTKHTLSKSEEYKRWINMKTRCYNPKFKNYHLYGGRGINVCDRWVNCFQNFFDDMQLIPTPKCKYSLERVDNNKGYSPENCIWATADVQMRNRRISILVEHNSEIRTLSEWAKIFDMPERNLFRRYHNGIVGNELFYKGKFKKGQVKKVKNENMRMR